MHPLAPKPQQQQPREDRNAYASLTHFRAWQEIVWGKGQSGAQNLAILRLKHHQSKAGVIDNNRGEDNSTFATDHKAVRIEGKYAC
jgi:hypothetical protein